MKQYPRYNSTLKVTVDTCKGCGHDRPIANKKEGLCSTCNSRKKYKQTLTDGKPQREKEKGRYESKTRTEKPEAIRAMEFKMELWAKRRHVCSGCNKNLGDIFQNVFHSHIVRRSQAWSLRFTPENIVYDCGDPIGGTGCHTKWDNGTIEEKITLNNFEHRIEYCKKNAPHVYQRLIDQLQTVSKEKLREHGLEKFGRQ